MTNTGVDARFGRREQQVVATRDEMNTPFEQVDPWFDRIDACIREEEARTRAHFDVIFEKMVATVQVVAQQARAVAQKQDKLEADHDALTRRVGRLEVRVDSLKRKRS
ncbi:MAG: hypothetical protein ACM3NQ_11505 [Bacteroidales bacterium]